MLTIPGRIPINIHPFFWVLCFGIGFLNTLSVAGMMIWALIIFFSILIHEYGHALTALAFGQQAQIDLIALGGLTSRHGKPLRLWQEFVIVLNGPVAGFALAGVAFVLSGVVREPSWVYALHVVVGINLFWTVVNLLPIHPLDGGRLLAIFLEGLLGVRGIQLALLLSLVVGGSFAVAAFVFSEMFIGAILFLLTFESYRAFRESLTLTSEDRSDSVKALFHQAEEKLQQGKFTEAEASLRQVFDKTEKGVLHVAAATQLAELLARRRQYQEAYQLLRPLVGKLDEGEIPLLHQLAWKASDLEGVLACGDQAYQVKSDYETALINAFAYAGLRQVEPAIGWLKRAISDGLPDVAHVMAQSEFDPIRTEQGWARIDKDM